MTRTIGTGVAVGLVLATVALAQSDSPATAIARHAYFAPVLLAALRFGLLGGLLTGLAAMLLAAPFVLPDVEVAGVDARIVDALLVYPMLVLGGWLAGALVGQARRHRERHRAAMAAQALLSEGDGLMESLERLRGPLADRFRADVALVVRQDDGLLVAGGAGVAAGSLAAHVLASGTPAFVADVGAAPWPRRVLVVPLVARGLTVGVLAVERSGEIGAGDRATVEALGANIGLGLENARLAAAQRRFNEELARRVAEATARAEAIDRAKTAFVATASHELRTPLTALQGFGELLATRTFPVAEVRRLGGIVQTEAERLARIVTDLLDVSRLERGLPPVLRRTPLRLDVAATAAVEVFRGIGRHHLVVACDDGLPVVSADPDAVDRVLRNLLSNASKYAPAGTVITVTARARHDGVELAIADEGPGITSEALAHVFEPYFRAPGTATVPGTGIGLAVVKSLVEAHGGRVALTSAPGQGTRATVVLPVASEARVP